MQLSKEVIEYTVNGILSNYIESAGEASEQLFNGQCKLSFKKMGLTKVAALKLIMAHADGDTLEILEGQELTAAQVRNEFYTVFSDNFLWEIKNFKSEKLMRKTLTSLDIF